jgi:hypothetical protein
VLAARPRTSDEGGGRSPTTTDDDRLRNAQQRTAAPSVSATPPSTWIARQIRPACRAQRRARHED